MDIDVYQAWKTQDIAFIAEINEQYNRPQQPVFPKIQKIGDEYADGFLAKVIKTTKKPKQNEKINGNTK